MFHTWMVFAGLGIMRVSSSTSYASLIPSSHAILSKVSSFSFDATRTEVVMIKIKIKRESDI